MHTARLIRTSGIGNEKEAEQRASSAFLAVLSVVRDLSHELLAPLGASRAQRANIETFTEVGFVLDKRKVRPDGLIRVTYGKSEWTCLVEVKTGESTLEAQQINDYWDIARQERFDHVLTISNEIALAPGAHPTEGLRVRSNSPVQVSHLSWTAILTTAVRLKQHAGVDDPEQAWILGELIRYLEHPASGALAFSDMGPNWVGVRDAARTNTLAKNSEGVSDIVGRFDQLLRYSALKLGSEIGADVAHVLPKAQREPKQRAAHLCEQLLGHGRLDGVLRIPHTAGDLEVTADLRGQQVVLAMEVMAPGDKGARGRVSWLLSQLRDAPGNLEIEAWAKNARTPTSALHAQLIDDRTLLLGDDKREPAKFRLVLRRPMGAARKSGGKNPGFIDSVIGLLEEFYGDVVQNVTPWVPPAPKVKRPLPLDEGPLSEEGSAPPSEMLAGTATTPPSVAPAAPAAVTDKTLHSHERNGLETAVMRATTDNVAEPAAIPSSPFQ
jgi:hypothetical protein